MIKVNNGYAFGIGGAVAASLLLNSVGDSQLSAVSPFYGDYLYYN